jgi:Ni,Fe-hydrogenase III small subunit
MTPADENRPGRGSTIAVLALETGGCGACTESIMALHSPLYKAELAAHRITFVDSPRQADVVLVSGPLSTEADQAVRRVLAVVPEPQALVAIGDCAINGCVFAGSSLISASAAESLDVHVELPGCPPTPSSILNALSRAAQLLDEGLEAEEESEEESDRESETVDADIDEDQTTEDEDLDEQEEQEPIVEDQAGEGDGSEDTREPDTTRTEGEE